MKPTNFFTNSTKILKLKGQPTSKEITNAYINLTFAPKFRKVFILNEELVNEFVKYHEAYVVAIRELSMQIGEANPDFYPADQLFNLLFNQGVYHFLKENYLKAGEKLEEAARMNNKDILTQIYLGIILMKRKNYYAAERYFLRSIELDKENEYAWYFLGKTYLKADKLTKASATFRKVENLSFFNNEIAAKTKDAFREIEKLRFKKEKKSLLSRVFKK